MFEGQHDETIMGEAFARAGWKSARERLREAAHEALDEAGRDFAGACAGFRALLRGDGSLWEALADELGRGDPMIRAYLRQIAQELQIRDHVRGGGHAAHGPYVPTPAGGASAPPAGGKRPDTGDHVAVGGDIAQRTNVPDARPTGTAGGNQVRRGRGTAQWSCVPAGPSPLEKAAQLEIAQAAARSILDSLTMRNGKAVGDCTRLELVQMAEENHREGFLCSLLLRRAAHLPAKARVRDWCAAGDVERAMADAEAEWQRQATANGGYRHDN